MPKKATSKPMPRRYPTPMPAADTESSNRDRCKWRNLNKEQKPFFGLTPDDDFDEAKRRWLQEQKLREEERAKAEEMLDTLREMKGTFFTRVLLADQEVMSGNMKKGKRNSKKLVLKRPASSWKKFKIVA